MKPSIEILIIDDHPAICEGINSILNTMVKKPLTVRFALNSSDAIKLLKIKPVNLIILDVNIGDESGLTLLKQLKKWATTPVLVMSFHTDCRTINSMLKEGANGYVSKMISTKELVQAFEAVLSGSSYFDDETYNAILKGSTNKPDEFLTSREVEILTLLSKDLTQDEIAKTLSISPRTVEGHARNLRIKLNVRSTAGMVHYAYLNNLVE